MNSFERDFLRMIRDTIQKGNLKGDRTGTGTHSMFANAIRVDISDGQAPVLFSKTVYNRSYIIETIWFLSGSTNIRFLKDNKVGIWDEWVIPKTAEFAPITEEARLHTLIWSKGISMDVAAGQKFTHEEIDSIAADNNLAINGKFHTISDKDLFNYVRCMMPVEYSCWQTLLKHKKVQNTHKDFRDFVTENKMWDDIPEVKLVAGDIGVGAYGSMWRNWEDTRIIDKAQEQDYYNRGYQYVADIPRAANWAKGTVGAPEDHVVVHRNIDQIADAIKLLKNNPDSRRIIVTAWNPGRIEDAALPPCHSLFSFYTADRKPSEIESEIAAGRGKDFLEWTAKASAMIEGGLAEDHPDITTALFQYAKEKGYATKKLSCFLYMR